MNAISILFAGDFCSKPSTSHISVDSGLKSLIQSCDFSVVNFEVPLKPDVDLPSQERERFFQNDDAPVFLKNLGFNLFSLANNHAFDWEDSGYLKTRASLGDMAFGSGSYDEAYGVKVVESKGLKIGFWAVCFAAYKGVFSDVMNHNGLGCAYINDLKVNHVIIEAKKSVDYLFVLPHDGIEYIDAPLPETIARYRDFIDYGADGVIASHPHCPQGWEEYKGKPIFYSLGNFFFNSKPIVDFHCTKPHWYEGRCVVLRIENGNLTWSVVNTYNKENQELVVDHSKQSIEHNEYLCRLLKDSILYKTYVFEKMENDYNRMLLKIDTTIHQNNLKAVFRALLICCKRKVKKMSDVSDASIESLFKHDLYRSIMVRMRKKN